MAEWGVIARKFADLLANSMRQQFSLAVLARCSYGTTLFYHPPGYFHPGRAKRLGMPEHLSKRARLWRISVGSGKSVGLR